MIKKVKLILATVITFIVTAVPLINFDMASKQDTIYHLELGFPAYWFSFYTVTNSFSFNVLGLILNIALFYFLLSTIERTYLFLKQEQGSSTSQSQ